MAAQLPEWVLVHKLRASCDASVVAVGVGLCLYYTFFVFGTFSPSNFLRLPAELFSLSTLATAILFAAIIFPLEYINSTVLEGRIPAL